MGVNDVNFPTNVRSDEEAIQYLGIMVQALKNQAYTPLTGASGTFTAAQMVGGVIEVSGGSTYAATTDTAVAIVARMQALDANAGVGSTASFAVVNDNSGLLTYTPGTGVTFIGGLPSNVTQSTATVRRFQIKILTLTTVSLTVVN